MSRLGVINHLIKKYKYKSYLEIGVFEGDVFKNVVADFKECVDISDEFFQPTYLMTSDKFFAQNTNRYDIIFIDGWHEKEQVLRDVFNSATILTENGVIIVHDCSPSNEIGTRIPREADNFWGTVWKAFLLIRQMKNFDSICTDFDEGCGIIKKRTNTNILEESIDVESLTYADLDKQREYLLNIKPFAKIDKWLEGRL